MQITSVVLPLALAFFVAFVLVLPLVRQRVRTGIWGLVVRESSTPVESFVRWWTMGLFVVIAMWAVLVPIAGAGRLGAWEVSDAISWIGLAFLAVGFAIIAAAQAQMGASWRIGIDDGPTALVTSGLFRWVRHPIYTGVLSVLIGITLLTPAPWTIAGFLVGYILIAIQSRLEDDHIRGQHARQFEDWASRTGRFIPGVGQWHGAESKRT